MDDDDDDELFFDDGRGVVVEGRRKRGSCNTHFVHIERVDENMPNFMLKGHELKEKKADAEGVEGGR